MTVRNNAQYLFDFRRVRYVKIFVVAFVFFFIAQCRTKKEEPAETKETYAGLSDSVRYVGINTCRECHQSVYETFIKTGMGSSFDVASKHKSAARFDEHALVYDTIKNFYYKPFWQGDSLKFMEFRLQGKDTVHKRIETVNYIVGSGQHTNSHIINTNGYLNQAPMTFYTQKGHWDLPPGFENGGNSRFSRLIGLECMSCHNAYPEFVLGSENKFDVVKNGIDCERCHGPGAKHVADKRAGKLVDISKEIDYSIVNPAKLPVALQLDICQRCHIQGNAVLNEEKSFFDFKPGMHLSDVMNVFMPVYAGRPDEHIMASHAERLKMSKCFTETLKSVESGNEKNALRPYEHALTCVTCHDPHVSVKVTNNDVFNGTCKNCHSETLKNECTEKPEKLAAENYNCVTCHMPKSGATDIPHVRVTDHYISKPLEKEYVKKLKEFVGIACINNTSPSSTAKGNAFIAYYEKFNFGKQVLDSALHYFPASTPQQVSENFSSLVRIYFLKNDFGKITELVTLAGNVLAKLNRTSFSNADAWTCYRVGEAYYNLNQPENALTFYRRAVELAPYELDFQNKYGTVLLQSGNVKEAKKVFEFITSQYPKDAVALSNLGFIYLSAYRDSAKARQLYENALALNPDYAQAKYNLAGLYVYRRNYKEAKKILTAMLKADPADAKAKEILNSISSIQ